MTKFSPYISLSTYASVTCSYIVYYIFFKYNSNVSMYAMNFKPFQSFTLDRETGKKSFLLGRARFFKKHDVYPSKEEKAAIPESSRCVCITSLTSLPISI